MLNFSTQEAAAGSYRAREANSAWDPLLRDQPQTAKLHERANFLAVVNADSLKARLEGDRARRLFFVDGPGTR